jgi:hypothetical protein
MSPTTQVLHERCAYGKRAKDGGESNPRQLGLAEQFSGAHSDVLMIAHRGGALHPQQVPNNAQ